MDEQDPAQIGHFDSPVFGPARDATNAEAAFIEQLAADCPAAVFGALNRKLNRRGLLIKIDALLQPAFQTPSSQCPLPSRLELADDMRRAAGIAPGGRNDDHGEGDHDAAEIR